MPDHILLDDIIDDIDTVKAHVQVLEDGATELTKFTGVVLFSSHDHEFIQTVANRIIEITPDGCIDRAGSYEEYLEWKSSQNK